jgi:hypothetical protein
MFLLQELDERMEKLKKEYGSSDDTFVRMRAKHKISTLRAFRNNVVRGYQAIQACGSCKGAGNFPAGATPMEEGGQCLSCDGTGKKKTVLYG